MKARNGKIARIPLEIREQLNARLADGEPGNRLVEWLNSSPDVVRVMTEQFEGRPITENNLSEWRAGGYEEWLTLQDFLDETHVLSENASEVADTGISSDHLHIVLLAHHARLLKNLETMPENEFKTRLNTVRKLTASIMNLRRDELQRARLELQRERLEFLREKESMKSPSSSKTASSTSSRIARLAPTETAQPAKPATAPTRPEIRPSAKLSCDHDDAPTLLTLAPKPAPEISILLSRIQSEFLDPSVEMPTLRDWLDSVGLGPISPRRPCGPGFPGCPDSPQKNAA